MPKLGYPYYRNRRCDTALHQARRCRRSKRDRPSKRRSATPSTGRSRRGCFGGSLRTNSACPAISAVNRDGIANQVWKDSWDSMSHADGTIANHAAPVASLEAQALAYDALVEVGSCRQPTDSPDRSRSTFGSAISMRSASTAILRPVRRVRSVHACRTWVGCCAPDCSTDAKIANEESSSCSSPMSSSPRRASARSDPEVRFRPAELPQRDSMGARQLLDLARSRTARLRRHRRTSCAAGSHRSAARTHRFPEFVAGGQAG